ncbi:hypothetical protein HMPREF1484_02015 [Dermabacter sp. HFH0086]|uniref:hypothetical protein n=1 Tax=Dermabacter TaxID=36739 RepID=UPI0003539691|nr:MULTISPECIES: hypothetical protein [Dermabacter]EPH14706.1 hypothetical protein HMPREF1484_02015 [Dermabacter sp. HFH0086]
MLRDPKSAEQMILNQITDVIYKAHHHAYLYDFKDEWAEYVTALSLHRLANAWERRVEIAEATARQKGIDL